ncbi:Cytochrome bd quinol oxidase subunit II [Desulfatibacillum aliphaticivorans]|uniref:Cytochrome bd quinol oxidase subunit II n=1 Tax=Desulfatibacillum aliphaticivorans TaxID=218208 RepID=B8FAW5_DESAL|nr:cytochrome d ubiquinol oxidase subunit II [Desulfatibacillum aliphaticivorans]ACL04051.1 Cytochrome bd quinol oxidase subunit II [Desulfatibacillum aliphaticivorans]
MVLQNIWFFLWGLLWAIFFMTDGFVFGMGTMYPFLGKTEEEKRIMINSVGPLWDGNEVWLITAGGVTFAAFPDVYATMFSTLYTPLMLILFALILRGVSFEFRGKVDSPKWKRVWDTTIFIGNFAPALLFGVAFANIFQGIPFDENGIFQGTLITLLNPYGLIGGVVFVLMFIVHGSLWLAIKTEGDLQARAIQTGKRLWPVMVGAIVVCLIASAVFTDLYDNYLANPVLFLILVLAVAGLLGIKVFMGKEAWFKAWGCSCLSIVGVTFFGVAGLFPRLYPSSINADLSLTAHNASSSPLTLKIMLVVVVIFIPIVLAYQTWAYKLFSDKVTEEDLSHEEAY